jgi:DNA-binding MarR family transcriptional regulator
MPSHPAPTLPAHDADREALVRELSIQAMTALRALQHEARRAFEPLGLRPSQVLVLELIHRGLDQPKVLAESLDTVQSAVTAILNDLQEHGLIDRAPDPGDRRRVRVWATEAGQQALARAGRVWMLAAEASLADVAIEDLRATARVVRVLTSGGPPVREGPP